MPPTSGFQQFLNRTVVFFCMTQTVKMEATVPLKCCYLPLNMESNSKTVFINMTVTTSKLTKEKLLFMNGCECKSPASTTGILKLVPRRDNLVCLGLWWQIMIRQWNIWATFNVLTTYWIFMTYGTSHIQHHSYVFKKQFQLTLPHYELQHLHAEH